MEQISAKELDARLKGGAGLQLVDVRSSGEYAAGHLPQAVNIPMEQVEMRLDDLRPGEKVVLVCQSGRRACLTYDLLDAHRDDLVVLDGGTNAWVQAGLPVVESAGSRWSLERQVRLIAGLMVLVGVVLGFTLAPGWFFLSGFVGAGLAFAGATNICGMALLLAVMPWNKAKKLSGASCEVCS